MFWKDEFQGRLSLENIVKLNISHLIFFDVSVSSCMSRLNCRRLLILRVFLQLLLFYRCGVQIDTLIRPIFFYLIPQLLLLLFFTWALCLLRSLLRNWKWCPARRRLPFWISSIYRRSRNILISVLSIWWNSYIFFCQSLLSINIVILIIVSPWWSSA
jgi:hypothetical protein